MSLLNTLIPTSQRASVQPAVSTVRPVYHVNETAAAFDLTVYLPGVAKTCLELTAEDGVLVVRGTRAAKQPEGWTALYRETSDAAYELTLTHDNTIDADKIDAELKDGGLRVTLPKAESVKPRKIAVA